MSIILSGDGSITGLTSTGISAAQTVTSANMPAGSVLQVVSTSTQSTFSTTSTSFTDAGFSLAITPKASTSKILVMFSLNGVYHTANANQAPSFQVVRTGASSATIPFMTNFMYSNTSIDFTGALSLQYLDSPATTSATTYKLQWYSRLGQTVKFNEDGGGGDTSTITLIEVAA
jgi:hypothetical protein